MGNRVTPGGDGAVPVPLDVEDLFWFNRRRPNAPVVVCGLFLVLWGPIGVVLVLLRAIILFGSLAVLYNAPVCISRYSRSYVRFVLFPLMGWLPWVTNRRHFTRTPNPKIVAMNHPSNFDPLWTHAFLGKCTVIAHEDFYWFFDFMARAGLVQRRIYTARYSGPEGQQRIQREIAEATADGATQPLLVYPEGAVNPAQYGLMRYEKYCFSLGRPVVPVALRCINPWPFEYTLIHASDFADMFWLLFLPFLIWSFDVGSPMTIEPGQDAIAFSKQVQRWVADRLRVAATDHSWVAKDAFLMALDWEKYAAQTFDKRKTTLEHERRAIQLRAADCLAATDASRRHHTLGRLVSRRLEQVRADGYVTLGQRRQSRERPDRVLALSWAWAWRALTCRKLPPDERDLKFQARVAELRRQLKLGLTQPPLCVATTVPAGSSQTAAVLRDVEGGTTTGDEEISSSDGSVDSVRLRFEP
jgi:1-acyl-sn-glycerol-3-phosphate acyltransferase